MTESYSVRAILSAVDSSFSSTLARAGQATQNFGSAVNQKMQGVGKAMTVAGAAATAMGTKALKGFGDFQQTLNTTAVVAGGTSKNIGELSDLANKMGEDLPLSAQEAANAMLEMARNGASLDDIKKQFPAIAEASTAAGSDLQTTAGVVQQAMNIWSDSLKSPQQAAAILVQTANASNASVEDMQQALATIGSTAKMAGMDMGTTAEAIGLLTNRGFSAAQASDDLNHAIAQMLAPSSIAKKQMDALGLTFVDSAGKMKPFPTILQEIADKTKGMGDAQKTAALKAMFGASGMKAIAPLLDAINNKSGNAARSWSAYAAEQDKAAGSTARASKYLSGQSAEMQKNVGASLEQVGGAWESLRNKSMESAKKINGQYLGLIKNTMDWATKSKSGTAQAIRGFIGLSPVIGSATTALGGFITNAGKIISTGGSILRTFGHMGQVIKAAFVAEDLASFISAMGKLAETNKIAAAAQWALNAAMDVNPFVLIAAAIAAVVTALVLFFTKTKTGQKLWGEFVKWLQNAWNTLKNDASTIWNAISDAVTHPVETIKKVWNGIKDFFIQLWQAIVNTGKATWQVFVEFFSALIEQIKQIWNGIKDFFGQLWQGIVDIAKQVWQGFVEFFAPIVTAIQTVWQPIGEFFSNLWNGIKEFAGQIWQGIQLLITNPVQFIQNLWTNLTTFFSNLWNMIVQGAHAIWDTFAQIFSPIVEAVKNIWNGLTEFFSNLWNSIKNITSQIWDTIKQVVTTAINIVKSVINNVLNGIKNLWNNTWNGIKNIASTVWNGIKNVVSQGANAIHNGVSNAMSRIKSAFSNGWNTAKNVTSNGINGAANIVRRVASGMASAGRNFVMGFVNGIRGAIGSAANAAAHMARAAMNAAKAALGIHSPSRVMRDEVGYYVAAGMAVGMRDNADLVQKAANRMAESAIPSVNLGNSINGVMAQGNLSRQVNGTINHELTVNQQPAYINVALGGSEYSTFVEDISREQGNQASLQRNYRF